MKTPYQPKKPNALAAKGKDKNSRKQLKQDSKKYLFLLRFCQFSSKHELHSCTWFKRGTHHFNTWGPKMSNNIEYDSSAGVHHDYAI
jgi:hypothetical protein